jgi:Ferredoxin
MKVIRVYIEPREACVSEMVCTVLCPEVFEITREDGRAAVKASWRSSKNNLSEGFVGDDLEDCILAAVENCPVEIIRWEKVDRRV